MIRSDIPRIALIGVTQYARIYVDLIRKFQEANKVRLQALMVREKRADHESVIELQKLGAEVYYDFEQMLVEEKGKIDLCIIPTGIHLHTSMTVHALKHGANVLVEKPLCGSTSDLTKIIKAEKETGKWVAVGFQDLYSATTSELKNQLSDGVIGQIQTIKIIGSWPRSIEYYQRNDWAGKLTVNGVATMDSPLNNAFAHFINLALYLVESTTNRINARSHLSAELYRVHDIETFDTAIVKGKLDHDINFWIGVSHSCEERIEPEIHIAGENGTVQWTHEKTVLVCRKGEPVKQLNLTSSEQNRTSMFMTVLDKIADSKVWVCDSEIASHQVKFIEAIHQKSQIQTIPSSQINHVKIQGSLTPVIREIGPKMKEAFKHNQLLNEVNSPE